MARYDLVFQGELVEGMDPKQVRRNLEALFKADASRISRLFTGKPVVIRKDLDGESAQRYRVAMQKAGALCRLRPRDEPGGGAGVEILPPGSILTRPEPVAPPRFDLSGFSMAPAGSTLVESASRPAPPPDALRAEVAAPGTDLDDAPPPAPVPQPDISGMTMSPPGSPVLSPDEACREPLPPPEPGNLSLVPIPGEDKK